MDIDVHADSSMMDSNPISTVLATPSLDQDSLSPLADEDENMEDDIDLRSRKSQSQKGVRIDDHYYFEDEESEVIEKKQIKSKNDFQEAWYVSDSNESDDEEEDSEVEMQEAYEDEFELEYQEEDQSEMDDSASEMHIDLSPEEEARQ
jgi:pre-rRNA-processing protein TSR1